ncbi:AAA family ATPase [Frankia sp. Cr1]|uniref:AAA family ATPase n=1 Tax=Frankia sp. Cr1 TaxID=3073931 RepID=UPI002AD201BC|nr:AAA family ATPase [Frankia sp. Cr1]
MVPAPRFRRVAALQREFVDREPVLEAFAAELGRLGDGPRILNLTGVGGIGKSRLLRELKDRAREAHRTATLDLQIPALRQQEDALAALRGEIGALGIHFDRFDIAYAVLWQRLHPHLRLDKAELPFLDGSSMLTDVVDTVAGLPFFGTARGLIRILERGSSDVRRRMQVRRDNTLQILDDLPNSDLADAVTYLFAADLRDGSAEKPYVLFVDSYEALVPAPVRSGRAHLADGWLRDLCAQLDAGLVVVASREPLRWETDEPEWSDAVRVRDIGGLPMAARLDLLEAGGITDPAHRHTVAEASAGLPFYLHLAVDTYQQSDAATGRAAVSQSQILARFLEHVSADEIRTLEVLSPARLFDYEVFRFLAARFHLPGDRLAWESLTSYSFVYPAGDALRFHQLMGAALSTRLPPPSFTTSTPPCARCGTNEPTPSPPGTTDLPVPGRCAKRSSTAWPPPPSAAPSCSTTPTGPYAAAATAPPPGSPTTYATGWRSGPRMTLATSATSATSATCPRRWSASKPKPPSGSAMPRPQFVSPSLPPPRPTSPRRSAPGWRSPPATASASRATPAKPSPCSSACGSRPPEHPGYRRGCGPATCTWRKADSATPKPSPPTSTRSPPPTTPSSGAMSPDSVTSPVGSPSTSTPPVATSTKPPPATRHPAAPWVWPTSRPTAPNCSALSSPTRR